MTKMFFNAFRIPSCFFPLTSTAQFNRVAAVNGSERNTDVAREGDSKSSEELLSSVYADLRKLAASKMGHEKPGQTLQPTALVHEAWLKEGGTNRKWQNRDHLIACLATAMGQILTDNARRKARIKHGGGQTPVHLDQVEVPIPGVSDEGDDRVFALNDALEKLGKTNPEQAQLVALRFIAGYTTEEAAKMLNVSVRTADRLWEGAREKLAQELVSGQRSGWGAT